MSKDPDQQRSPLQKLLDDPTKFPNLRDYARQFQAALGMTRGQVNKALGHQKAEHFFRWDRAQWRLVTEKTYKQLLKLPRDPAFEPRPWTELKTEYDRLKDSYPKEEESRFFEYQKGVTEVITHSTVAGQWHNSDHPTTKPVPLAQILIRSTCRPGGVILDAFMGSGSVGMAARLEGRKFIGIEKERQWFDLATQRINNLDDLLPKKHPQKGKITSLDVSQM